MESLLKKFIDFFREREGERRSGKERERQGWGGERFVVLLIDAFIGWFLYVSWLGTEPNLGVSGDALTLPD